MRKSFGIVLFIACWIVLTVIGCKPDPSLDPDKDNGALVSFDVPQGWPQPVYTFQNNPLTQAGFQLGRKLFYDTRLSRDNSISCASCHQQFAAFSHLDHPLSHGIYGLFGKRNAPALFNEAWLPTFFWDGGVINIENQPINPIENPVEMNETMPEVIAKVTADADYSKRFKAAFGDETINSQRIFKALSQFMCAMVSSNSRYDQYMRGTGSLSTQELNGLTLFRAKCASCHKEPMFTDYSFRNNGLTPDAALNDSGRAHITGLAEDMRKFKVPSLRNIDLTRPYAHDGRFNTLDAMLEHYRTGIYQSATLDTALSNGIQMSDNEKQDIIAFLKTLTDTSFVKDPRFAEPK